MSRLLLDTHALLWFVFDDPRMSSTAAALIEDPGSTKLLSMASLWEITIKVQLGKLVLGMDLATFFREHVELRDMGLVPLDLAQLLAYGGLPLHHRDPFDRLIIAQAQVLNVPLISAERAFAGYDIEVLW